MKQSGIKASKKVQTDTTVSYKIDKINDDTIVNTFKQISERGKREGSSSEILQINTVQYQDHIIIKQPLVRNLSIIVDLNTMEAWLRLTWLFYVWAMAITKRHSEFFMRTVALKCTMDQELPALLHITRQMLCVHSLDGSTFLHEMTSRLPA